MKKLMLIGLLVALSASAAFAWMAWDVPFQGRVTTSGGTVVPNGSYSMTFSIFADSVGGSPLWTETQMVQVDDGLYSVMLGSVNPILFDISDAVRYIQTTFNGQTMTPRTKLGSVPSAFVARQTSQLIDHSGNGLIDLSGGTDTVSLRITGTGMVLRDSTGDTLLSVLRNRITFSDGSSMTTAAVGNGCWICPTGNYTYLSENKDSVGIGTATPTEKLTITGPGRFGSGQFDPWSLARKGLIVAEQGADAWGRSNNDTTGIYLPANTTDYSVIYGKTNATRTDMVLTVGDDPDDNILLVPSGNVGVGTATPTAKLDVAGDIRTTGSLILPTAFGRIKNNLNRAILESDWLGNFGDYTAINSGYDWDLAHEPLSMVAGNHGIYFMRGTFGTPYTTQLVKVDSVGRMVLGTVAATAKLDVVGSTGYNQVRMRTSYTPTGTADPNGNTGDIAWDNSYMYVKTGAGWKRAALSIW